VPAVLGHAGSALATDARNVANRFNLKARVRFTVSRDVGAMVNVFTSVGAMASDCGNRVTVTLSEFGLGLPTRMSYAKLALLAPSARNHVEAPCADAGGAAAATQSPASTNTRVESSTGTSTSAWR
jgi:hypothetical protein